MYPELCTNSDNRCDVRLPVRHQSRLRRARPSAFRLPAFRTAGGKLHALKAGALWSGYFRLGNKPRTYNVEEEGNCVCIAVFVEAYMRFMA